MQSSKINFKPSALGTQKTIPSIGIFDKNISSTNIFSDSFAKLTKSKLTNTEDSKNHNDISTSSTSAISSYINSQYIFGQNIEDRVENAHPTSSANSDNGLISHTVFAPDSTVREVGNPSNDDVENETFHNFNYNENNILVTTSQASKNDVNNEDNFLLTPVVTSSDSNTGNLGIKESAKRHYENLQNAKKAEQDLNNSEVIISSGEEDEITVFQAYGKLYEFASDEQMWFEKGSGYLKLNDLKDSSDGLKSRLIMRSQGNFRVLLNSKVFIGTGADNPTKKSLRFLATESDSISPRVYLFKGNATDVEVLTSALNSRVSEMSRQNNQGSSGLINSPDHPDAGICSGLQNHALPVISLAQGKLGAAGGIGYKDFRDGEPTLEHGKGAEGSSVSSSGFNSRKEEIKESLVPGTKRKLSEEQLIEFEVATTSKKPSNPTNASNNYNQDSEDSENAYLESLSTDEEIAPSNYESHNNPVEENEKIFVNSSLPTSSEKLPRD